MSSIKVMAVAISSAFLLVSALAVVYSKYQARLLFIKIQQKEKELNEYEVQWGRLQLEKTTLTEEYRVEANAIRQLKMKMPEREKTVYIKP